MSFALLSNSREVKQFTKDDRFINRKEEAKKAYEEYAEVFPMAVPHWVVDDLMPLLAPGEFVVLIAAIRHISSSGSDECYISNGDFSNGVTHQDGTIKSGTGMGHNTVRRCLQTLTDSRILSRRSVYCTSRGGGMLPMYKLLTKDDVDFELLKKKTEKRKAVGIRKGKALTEARIALREDDRRDD